LRRSCFDRSYPERPSCKYPASTSNYNVVTAISSSGSGSRSIYLSLRTVSHNNNNNKSWEEMATASILQWVPESLYNLSVSVTVCNYHIYRAEVKSLPDSVQFDVLYKVSQPHLRYYVTVYTENENGSSRLRSANGV